MEKNNAKYYGIVHQDGDGDLGISFPDFPGCISGGSSLAELGHNAIEALQFHIDGMVEDGLPIPDPSHLEDIGDEQDQFISAMQIDVNVPVASIGRYNITAKKSDMRVVDEYLRRQGRERDRSGFLMKAALESITADKQRNNHLSV